MDYRQHYNELAFELEKEALEERINALENENKQLKDNIAMLAMEHSEALSKKRKTSPEVKERWAHYHAHKAEITLELKNAGWRDVKKRSDEIYYSKKA